MFKIVRGDRRLMIGKNLILMLVILALIFATIFAWFTQHKTVTADNMGVSAKAIDEVELALPEKVNGQDTFPLDNAKWSTSIEFTRSGYLKNLVKDVTSNGEQFVVPNFEASSDLAVGRTVNVDDLWVSGLSSKAALSNELLNDDDQYDYISFDFYIRSTTKDIHIREGSYLAAGSELGVNDDGEVVTQNGIVTSKKALVGSDVYRPSSYGPGTGQSECFSADAVVGAMRVSLVGSQVTAVDSQTRVETQNTPALSFLWLPRPDIYLHAAANSNDWRLLTNIGVNHANALNTYSHSFYEGLWKGSSESNKIQKGVTKKSYWDSSVKTPAETTESDVVKASSQTAGTSGTLDYFYVSDTREDSSLGTVGHYPTLGQVAKIAGDSVTSTSGITFNATSVEGDERPTTGYYVYKFTMNIWIEGEDPEARRSMNSGLFSMMLEFST